MYAGFFVAKNSPRLYDFTCRVVPLKGKAPPIQGLGKLSSMNEKKPANKWLGFFMPWMGLPGLYWELIRQGEDTQVSWRWYVYGWLVWGVAPLVAVMLWLLITS